MIGWNLFFFPFLNNSGKLNFCGVHSYIKRITKQSPWKSKGLMYHPCSWLQPKVWGKSRATRKFQYWGHNSSVHSTCGIFVLLPKLDFRKYKFSSCVYIEKNLTFLWILFWPKAGPWKGQNINSSTSVHWRVMLHEDKMGFVSCFIVFCADINKHGNLNNEP